MGEYFWWVTGFFRLIRNESEHCLYPVGTSSHTLNNLNPAENNMSSLQSLFTFPLQKKLFQRFGNFFK